MDTRSVLRSAGPDFASLAASAALMNLAEAEDQIALDQQLGVDAAVRIMTDRAALPQRRMLKYKGPGLLSVTLRTGFVPARHCQPPRRFEDVAAMRVVALRAVHLLLQHRVVLRKLKFPLLLAMALETSRGVFAGIDDELAFASASRDVQASCSSREAEAKASTS